MFGGGCVLGMGSRLRGNGRMFGGGCVLGMGSRLRGNDGCLGVAACWGWVPAFAGTTDGWFGGGCVLGMGSRLRGNDGCLGVAACWGWVPAFAGTTEVWGWLRLGMGSRLGGCLGVAACWGWVPAWAGTTDVWGWLRVGDGFPPSRERRIWGWLRVGDGFPPSRERRMFGRGCVLGMGSRLRGNGGRMRVGRRGAACWGWVPAFAGTTEVGASVREWVPGGAGGTRRGHCDRHTRGNGYPGARWGCGRGWGVWYTACVSLFVSLFLPGEPTVFSCVLTATAAASRARPPGPSTTVPEAIPEADERSASRRILGWVLGRGVRRADAPAAGPPIENPEPSP